MLGFFVICIWLTPFFLFVLFSSTEGALPFALDSSRGEYRRAGASPKLFTVYQFCVNSTVLYTQCNLRVTDMYFYSYSNIESLRIISSTARVPPQTQTCSRWATRTTWSRSTSGATVTSPSTCASWRPSGAWADARSVACAARVCTTRMATRCCRGKCGHVKLHRVRRSQSTRQSSDLQTFVCKSLLLFGASSNARIITHSVLK